MKYIDLNLILYTIMICLFFKYVTYNKKYIIY